MSLRLDDLSNDISRIVAQKRKPIVKTICGGIIHDVLELGNAFMLDVLGHFPNEGIPLRSGRPQKLGNIYTAMSLDISGRILELLGVIEMSHIPHHSLCVMASLRDRTIQRGDALTDLLIGLNTAKHEKHMPMRFFHFTRSIGIELMQRTFDPLNMELVNILPPILRGTFGIQNNSPISRSAILVPA